MSNLKICSWNVNSIRKGVKEELYSLINNENPDIICFQETKCTKEAGELYFVDETLLESYPYRYWNDSVSGQAGVSIWSNVKPINVYYEIPRLYQLKEGRIIIMEFEDMILVNTYVPNTGREIAENYRNVWHNSLMNWIPEQINNSKFFVWCGDLNVVSEPSLDTSHHETRNTKNKDIAGLKQFEKDHFDEYISLGLIDVFRTLYPDTVSFTWFSNFHTHVGWRLDYFLVNNISKVKDIIHNKRLSKSISDHTWIILEVIYK